VRGFVLLLVLAGCQTASHPPPIHEPHVLAAGATDRYPVALRQGESAAIVVTQQGVDVVVETFAPDGARLATVDSPNGREGDEPTEIVAARAGEYHVVVRALEPKASGHYTLAVTIRDAAQTRTVLAERERERGDAAAWLRARSGPITLRDASVDGAGLARFDALWAQARIVGLGEATHGSRQFGDMRLALTLRAIERSGVRVVGLEGSASRMRLVDAWTRDGAGDLAAMIGKQWINRRAFAALATAVRAWNVAHPADPVTIAGLDDQDNAPAREIVARAVRTLDPATATRADAVLARLVAAEAQAMIFGPSDVSPDDWRFLAQLVARLPADAQAAARTLAQSAEMNSGAPDAHSRDWLMAENLLTVAGERRALYWGHNAHVAHPPDKHGDRATTGGRFAERTGGAYAALALSFRDGGFLAQLPNDLQDRLQTFVVRAATADSIDGVLAPLGRAIVTWRDDRASPPAWLAAPRPMHWIGALYSEAPIPDQSYRPTRLLDEYDGVVVLDHVDAEPSTEIGVDRAP